MKIGIIKEGKLPPDRRVPFSPTQCKEIMSIFLNIEIAVQKSDIRIFTDDEYNQEGITLVEDVNDCDVLIGIKEVPVADLIPNKTYLFFSHTTKKQPHNQQLLKTLLEKKITLIDYEHLTDNDGKRIVGFGRYAGIVGCYNAFYAYGRRTADYTLKRAFLCFDKKEMVQEMAKIKLPNNFKMVLTGTGRVGKGALEVLDLMDIEQVTPKEILVQTFDRPVYAVLNAKDYYKANNGSEFIKTDFYQTPENYQSRFIDYAEVCDLYIACHFWNPLAPPILSSSDLKTSNLKLNTIADISCDTNGPIASTIRASSIEEPLYGYDPVHEVETTFNDQNGITVMAIDNLPGELARDASTYFGRKFIDLVLPELLNDTEKMIQRATLCAEGKLTNDYEYLQEFAKG